MSVKALVDCGVTGDFIDSEYVISRNLPFRHLSQPIPVLNVDGSPNQVGGITGVVDMMVDYEGHAERIQLAITQLRKQHVILGYSWLQKHNPEINWETKEVRMTRCLTGCRTRQDELQAIWRNKKLTTSILRQLCEGVILSTCAINSEEWHRDDGYNPADDDDLLDLCPDSDSDDDNDNKDELKEGDHILYTVFAPVEEIHAGSTVSQHLVEAHMQNSVLAGTLVPPWAVDFSDIFNKESFDSLLERWVWDHAIELIPDAKLANCKVYLISPLEQKELNAFITEGLSTGCICPSKSPMASPVFFVKKKDGALRFVQDYWALNAMTVKNWYLLPLINDLINRLKGARFFTKLDIQWGFNNVRIREGDKWKAVFHTDRGLFKSLVMYFGLTNSLATFQTMMNNILQDLILSGDGHGLPGSRIPTLPVTVKSSEKCSGGSENIASFSVWRSASSRSR
jgi:hypothetical protein